MPALLEFKTYRVLEHCGPNDDTKLGYRSEKDVQKWLDQCPITQLREELIAKEMLTKKDDEYMINLITNEVNKAFQYAENSKFPNSNELYTQVYFGE